MAWKLKFIAGSGEILHIPLTNGVTSIDRDVPVIVDNVKDYRRLIRSGKYVEIVEEKPKAKIAKPQPVQVEAAPEGAKDNKD